MFVTTFSAFSQALFQNLEIIKVLFHTWGYGPRLFGLYPNGLFTFGLPMMLGLSSFGLFWTYMDMRTIAIWTTMTFGLLPLGLQSELELWIRF